VTLVNTPGLVDAGYRGELRCVLVNTDPDADYEVRRGDRIAQLVIVAVEQVQLVVVDELPASERGSGGFGHSGR
jgi:dUTP pyrophosphatase